MLFCFLRDDEPIPGEGRFHPAGRRVELGIPGVLDFADVIDTQVPAFEKGDKLFFEVVLGRDAIDGDNASMQTTVGGFLKAGTNGRGRAKAITQIPLYQAKIGEHSRLERRDDEHEMAGF